MEPRCEWVIFMPRGSQEVWRARLPLPQVWLASPRLTQTMEAPHRGSCHAALWSWMPPTLFSLFPTQGGQREGTILGCWDGPVAAGMSLWDGPVAVGMVLWPGR